MQCTNARSMGNLELGSSMGLLDPIPEPWQPPKSRKFRKETELSQESRDTELNNHDRGEVTEDFSDSPFADRT